MAGPAPVHGRAEGEHDERVREREAATRGYIAALATAAGFNADDATMHTNRGRITVTTPGRAATNTQAAVPAQTHDLQLLSNVGNRNLLNPPFTSSRVVAQAAVTQPDGRVLIARRGLTADGTAYTGDTQYFWGQLQANGTYRPIPNSSPIARLELSPAQVQAADRIFTAAQPQLRGLVQQDAEGRLIVAGNTTQQPHRGTSLNA